MGYNLLINEVYWGYNPLILTFDPIFQRDIQVGGGFKYFLIFTPNFGEMIQFDEHIFQMG